MTHWMAFPFRVLMLLILPMPVCAIAADENKPPAKPETPPAKDSAEKKRPSWKDQLKPGMPPMRINGTSRGREDEKASVYILSPASYGFTRQPAPVVYWLITSPVKKVVLKVVENWGKDPATSLSAQLKDVKPGLHRLDLAQVARVNQKSFNMAGNSPEPIPGEDPYKGYVVSIRLDSSGPAAAQPAKAAVVRIEGASAAGQSSSDLLGGGIWYDGIAALVDEICANPGDAALRAALRDILAQVGALRGDAPTGGQSGAAVAEQQEKQLLDSLVKGIAIHAADAWEPYKR